MLNVTQGPANDFDFPPPSGQMGPNNSVFTIGDVLNLRWHTQFSQVNLIQRQNENDTEILLASNLATNSYIWKVTAGPFDLKTQNVFYLWVQDAQYGGVFGSSYLNFTTTGAIQSLGFTSTSSSPTSKATQSSGTQTSGSGASPTSDNQSSSSSAAAGTKSSGIGIGGIAGIAVGAVVLVIAVVFGWFFWYQRRKSSARATAVKQEHTDVMTYQAVARQHPGYAEAPGDIRHEPAEMGAYSKGEYNQGWVAELGDTAR